MAYLRFIVPARHPSSGVAAGIFVAAHDVARTEGTLASDRQVLEEQLKWFTKNLPTPTRFSRTTSKGHYRRNTKGIAWLREDAREHLARMHEIKRVLEDNGYVVHIMREDRVGYIVYRDDFQVIAEPFADTRTSG